jgi:hypothetical protein
MVITPGPSAAEARGEAVRNRALIKQAAILFLDILITPKHQNK